MRLYLAPATPANIAVSINNSVDPEWVRPFFAKDPEAFEELHAATAAEGFYCWAMTSGVRPIYNQMSIGDEVLLSESGTKMFTHYSRVIGKAISSEMGDALWPVTKNGRPWELIYFLGDIVRIDISKQAMVMRLGYNKSDHVSGVRRVTDKYWHPFQKAHGSVAQFLEIDFELETAERRSPELSRQPGMAEDRRAYGDQELDTTGDYRGSEIEASGKRRIGHPKWARQVKVNYDWRCAFSGITNREFLAAGHILPWKNYKEVRLDQCNGICLSLLYDRAFERGYLGLDENFQIMVSPLVKPESPLGEQLCHLQGKEMFLPFQKRPKQEILEIHREKIFKN